MVCYQEQNVLGRSQSHQGGSQHKIPGKVERPLGYLCNDAFQLPFLLVSWHSTQVYHREFNRRIVSNYLYWVTVPRKNGGAECFVSIHDSIEGVFQCRHIENTVQPDCLRLVICRAVGFELI